MINLGVIDIVMLALLIVVFAYASRRHRMWVFYLTLVVLLLIELERLAPGTLAAVGTAVHGIDAFNVQMPHVQISPIITVK